MDVFSIAAIYGWIDIIWLLQAKGHGHRLEFHQHSYQRQIFLALVAQSDMHLTRDQEVVGSIPNGSSNILWWRLRM